MPCTAAAAPEQGAVFPDDGRQGFVPAGGVGERCIAADTVPSGRAVEGAHGAVSLPRVHAGACLPRCAPAAGQHVHSASTDPARTRGATCSRPAAGMRRWVRPPSSLLLMPSVWRRHPRPRGTDAHDPPEQTRRRHSFAETSPCRRRPTFWIGMPDTSPGRR